MGREQQKGKRMAKKRDTRRDAGAAKPKQLRKRLR